jgi:hypothetical protein
MGKLNDVKVLEMRSKHAAGRTIESLSLEYGVSPNAARSAIKGLTYQHVEQIAGSEAGLEESQKKMLELINLGASLPSAQPEEDHLDEMLRRRSLAASTAAEAARIEHKAQNAQENPDEHSTKV